MPSLSGGFLRVFFRECVQSRRESRAGLIRVAATAWVLPLHQRDLHLLPPLHLPARVLLWGRRGGTDLDTTTTP